jgi:sugar-phosphatase
VLKIIDRAVSDRGYGRPVLEEKHGVEPLTGRTFTAVLFDMDGTLVDSSGAVERSWQRWAREFGLTMPGFDGWHGQPARSVAAALLPPHQRQAGVRRIEEIEVADVSDLTVLPGAAEALAAVPAGACAIVTSCTGPLAAARIGAAMLIAPDVLVTADQVARGKPDPEPFLLAAHRLGVDPADCLVVEDAPAGLTGARAAGMATLAVLTTHELHELESDAVVADLSAVRFQARDGGVTVLPA